MATNYCATPSSKVDETSEFINIKKVTSFNYTWCVENLKSKFESYESPVFSNALNSETKWRLKINRLICYNETINFRVQLRVESSDACKIQADCKFQILSSIPNKTIRVKKLLDFTIGTYMNCFDTRSYDDIMYSENGYLQGRNIILQCQIQVREISKPLSIPKCSLDENLNHIFENPKFSDVTICASGKEFKAHKAILAARSPVFNAMFDHDMEENKHNHVNITDIDGQVFGELLRFIYTGKVLNLKEYAGELLPAAEKYGFQKLKVLCGKALCTNISIENAAEALVLIDLYGLAQLKAVAIGFIGAHVAQVVRTAGWKLMTKSYPNLITEVLCDVAEQLGTVLLE